MKNIFFHSKMRKWIRSTCCCCCCYVLNHYMKHSKQRILSSSYSFQKPLPIIHSFSRVVKIPEHYYYHCVCVCFVFVANVCVFSFFHTMIMLLSSSFQQHNGQRFCTQFFVFALENKKYILHLFVLNQIIGN